MKINKYYEVEEALAKLLFYTKLSFYYKEYDKYKNYFKEIFKISKKWLIYYAEDKSLERMTNEEVITAKKILNQIPHEAYHGDYFEEVETFLDVVIYYGSCPINEYFDETKISKKGKIENGR